MVIGGGKMVKVELEDKRIVTLDLDCSDDWGDIRITPKYDDAFGKEPVKIELGNDCDGWFKIVRCWERIDKDGADLDFIDEKYDTYIEANMDDFIEWVLIREIAYCEGMTIAEHKELMEEYGFKYENLYIPKEWKECASDY